MSRWVDGMMERSGNGWIGICGDEWIGSSEFHVPKFQVKSGKWKMKSLNVERITNISIHKLQHSAFCFFLFFDIICKKGRQ